MVVGVLGALGTSCQQDYNVSTFNIPEVIPAPVNSPVGSTADNPVSNPLGPNPVLPVVVAPKIFQGATSVNEQCWSSVVDSEHNIYCAGSTTASWAETRGGGSDAFIMKLNPDGQRLWVRQLGKVSFQSQTVQASGVLMGVAVDLKRKAVYGVGATNQNGAFGEANAGSYDGLVVKLDSDTGAISWVKQFGTVTKKDGIQYANQGWMFFSR